MKFDPEKHQRCAHLVLSDGTVFTGTGFGATGLRTGEVVFNTSMTGYQEILTDPSYCGQIIVMNYPHIGNVGVNDLDVESREVFASGLVVKSLSPVISSYRAQNSLDDDLKKHNVPGIAGIDTRALVRHIREAGAMPAVLAVGTQRAVPKLQELKKMARLIPCMEGQNLAGKVSCPNPYHYQKGLKNFIPTQSLPHTKPIRRYSVVAYDFGAKENILRLLCELGCDVKVVPHDYPVREIIKDEDIDGVFLSNGPGDPAACVTAIANVRELLGRKPVFGICLGHQILSLALGARTYKLKFGHHGANHPVKNLQTGHVEITSQNHGFAVARESLPAEVEVTHVHLNDQTVAGIRHKTLPVFSVQYHPEASPGPHDSRYLFRQFLEYMT